MSWSYSSVRASASAPRQEPPSGIEAAAAVEKTLVRVIERNEKSVVAIARVRRERPGETFQFELAARSVRPPARAAGPAAADRSRLSFPTNTAPAWWSIGRGLILTACDVLGDESEYYVTTAERKVYKATVKAADPRSDLAVLAIDAADLPPITLGQRRRTEEGADRHQPGQSLRHRPRRPGERGVGDRLEPAAGRPRPRPANRIPPAAPRCTTTAR